MNPYEQVVMDRIRVLISYRRWIKRLLVNDPSRSAVWGPLDREYRAELAALVRLARQARKLEAAAPDPLSQYKSYAEWTESEKAEAFGR